MPLFKVVAEERRSATFYVVADYEGAAQEDAENLAGDVLAEVGDSAEVGAHVVKEVPSELIGEIHGDEPVWTGGGEGEWTTRVEVYPEQEEGQ